MGTIQVQNAGQLTGDEVVMAYFMPVGVKLDVHPVKSLFDFKRISDVPVGGAVDVVFSVDTKSLLLATQEGDLVSTPGVYNVVFENGAGESLKWEVGLTGKQVTV